MVFIVTDNKTYHVKLCVDSISDDHYGLDIEVKDILREGLNLDKNIRLIVGILSFSSNNIIPIYSSDMNLNALIFTMMTINGKLKKKDYIIFMTFFSLVLYG